MLKIGIVGGTGYTGVELLRILATHPGAEVVCVTSRGEAGTADDESADQVAVWVADVEEPELDGGTLVTDLDE